MKTILIVISIISTLSFNAYSQTAKANQLLQNKEERNETFNAILNNHELMMDFMEAMKGNEHAMMMMKSNNQMMDNNGKMGMGQEHQMVDNDKMMSMMKDNPEMMQKMMGSMMDICEKDSFMRCKMADMMVQHPEMMKTMMQKMKDKDQMKMDNKSMMQK